MAALAAAEPAVRLETGVEPGSTYELGRRVLVAGTVALLVARPGVPEPVGEVDDRVGFEAGGGRRLPEPTRRAILLLMEDNPDWGCACIAALLLRGPAPAASPEAVARVLRVTVPRAAVAVASSEIQTGRAG